MNMKSIKSKIALQPLAKLNAVLVAKGMLATNDKEQALSEVTILINDGHATFDDLANAVAQAPTSAVIPDDLRVQGSFHKSSLFHLLDIHRLDLNT